MPQSKSKQAKNETQETPEETKTHTLPELVNQLGEATEEEVARYIEGKTDAELIDEGADVGTTRIDTDAARLYGLASDFFKKATPEQRTAVMGISPTYLRVGAWAALQGSLQYEALGKHKRKGGGEREQLTIAADKSRERALARRKVLRAGLTSLAAGNASLVARIDHANGTATDASTLAEALETLADVGQSMLDKPSKAMKARLADSGLTKELLAADRALAAEVRKTGAAARGVLAGGDVTQTTVDRWDGINLFLLGNLIDVFEAGHADDPKVPRLVPIALRRYFGRHKSVAKQPETEGENTGSAPGASPEKPGGAKPKTP